MIIRTYAASIGKQAVIRNGEHARDGFDKSGPTGTNDAKAAKLRMDSAATGR